MSLCEIIACTVLLCTLPRAGKIHTSAWNTCQENIVQYWTTKLIYQQIYIYIYESVTAQTDYE